MTCMVGETSVTPRTGVRQVGRVMDWTVPYGMFVPG